MGELLKDVILSNIRRDVLGATLSKGARYDGRAFDEIRPLEVQKGVIPNAEGSALAILGGTKVLAAIKFDVLKPFPDRPMEGVLMTNAELLPTASPSFEPGPPGEECIELARVVDRAIRSAECVDVKRFYLAEEKVLGLFIDLYVLDHTGNYTDAANIAATAALLDARMPKVEDTKIIRGEYEGKLEIARTPISTTMVKIGDSWLVDPTRDEELAQETSITIGTTEEHVCSVQKRMGSLDKEELLSCIDIAFKTGNGIRDILKR